LEVASGDLTPGYFSNLRKVRYVVRGGVVRSIEELKAAVAAADPPPSRQSRDPSDLRSSG
jgi:hypothetical protein